MPKISQAHRESRQRQILEAAWRCFHRNGVQATTIQDIIDASGLSASAMYRYFPDKQGIIAAAIDTSLAELNEVLLPVFADPGVVGPAELAMGIAEHVEAYTRKRDFDLRAIAIQGWAEAQRDPKVKARIAAAYTAWRDTIIIRVRNWQKQGLLSKSAKPLDVANTVQAVVLGHVVQGALLGDVETRRIARGLHACSGIDGTYGN